MNHTKRLLSVLMTVMMALSIITVPAWAKGDQPGDGGQFPTDDGWNQGFWGEEIGEEGQKLDPIPETTPEPEPEPAVEEEPVYSAGSLYSESQNYKVSVTYGEDAEIPEGTAAVVTEYAEGSAEYNEAKAAVIGDSNDEAGFVAFDITLYNGSEIVEPKAAVNVSIELNNLPEDAIEAAETLEIQHLDESTGETVVETVATADEIIVDGDTALAEIEVESFSTFTITWRNRPSRTVTVHYVDESGNELNVSNSGTGVFGNLTANSSSPAFLIYDIEGYQYSYTYRNTNNTNNRIAPLLAKNNNNYWMYNVSRSVDYWGNVSWSGTELSNGDNIYVVYSKNPDITTGGTPTIETDEEWPSGDDLPEFEKTSKNNGDGTNTISLMITAGEKPVEESTPADVIVIFDVSGSMSNNMNGGTATQQNPSRLSLAKTAVNTMANTLLTNNSGVRLALISFSTDAELVQGFTNNYTTFSGKVNALSADGGTNWEKALKIANELEVRSDAATFVVFVTDGDPTFRVSRGDVTNSNLDMWSGDTYQYYRENAVFGEGSDDSQNRNFNYAVKQVSKIAGANKNFYAIGISTSVTKVQNLTTQGGVSADHAFIASDNAAMQEAFSSITESIKSALGFGDVEMNDGITDLTSTEMEMMHSVDPNSFKYYRYGGEGNKYGADEAHKTEWTTRAEDGCDPATYDEATGSVKWPMGDFQLEANVTYIVTFRCWPSQDAYDLVADLNNGIKTYDSLTDAEKAQIVELDTTPVTYALKTNTDQVSATYKKTSKTGDTVTIEDDTPITAHYTEGTMESMSLTSMQLSIKKEFEDDLTAGEDRETEVVLVLKRRNAHQTPEAEFEVYPVPQADGTVSEYIVLNEGNNWTYSLYIAPGFEVDGETLEHGYDFTIAEPGIDYHYGLIEEIINPMVVNGEEKYYGDGYLIDDQETVEQYIDRSLTAVNRVKSGIDVKKVLVDADGNEITPDVEFTIKGKLLDADGNPFLWQEGDDVNNSGAYHKYDKDGNRIVYKGHFADTSNIEFTLKPGEYIRFINVPEGCTFEFDEGTMPEGYEWNKTEALTQHRESAGGDFITDGDIQPAVDGSKAYLDNTVSETGVAGNKQYSVTFTNKALKGDWFFVYHSSDNTIEQVFVDDGTGRVTKDTSGDSVVYTFNIVNETKDGYLYGGYYKAYGGQKKTDAEIPELTFTDKGTETTAFEYLSSPRAGGFWATDAEGCTPYDASKVTGWKAANAYTADKGTAMHPESGKVYYLKEVPDGYLRPYIHIVYDTYHKDEEGNYDNPLTQFYLITATDDANYQDAGVLYDGTTKKAPGKLSASLKITTADGKSTMLTAKTIFNGKSYNGKSIAVPRGYLSAVNMTSELSSFANDDEFTMLPYFTTLDGVGVTAYGVTERTVNVGEKRYVKGDGGDGVAPGITVADEPVVPPYYD